MFKPFIIWSPVVLTRAALLALPGDPQMQKQLAGRRIIAWSSDLRWATMSVGQHQKPLDRIFRAGGIRVEEVPDAPPDSPRVVFLNQRPAHIVGSPRDRELARAHQAGVLTHDPVLGWLQGRPE